MKLGIIGFGDLGRSIVTGFVKGGVSQNDILVCDKLEHNIKKAHLLGVNNIDIDSLIEKSDVIFLAIPKKDYVELNVDFTKFMGKTVVSCLASVKIEELEARFNTRIVRVITTLASENCNAVVSVCFDKYADNKSELLDILKNLGTVIECSEDELIKLTSLAGCGLCYASYILDSFISTAENLGLSREMGAKIVEETFKGAIELGDYELLIGKIASHDGISSKGLAVLTENNVDKTIDNSFKTVYGSLIK